MIMRIVRLMWPCLVGVLLLVSTTAATAEDLSGVISSTRTIREDSRLVGDVTCAVTGAACIVFGSGHIELRLNGFTITGQADPATGCNGGSTGTETGISSGNQTDVAVRGPGVVQRFRGDGVLFVGTLLGHATALTTTTNCMSGIRVNPTSSKVTLEANVAVRNGTTNAPCGGI
jgi:hypothetical protein